MCLLNELVKQYAERRELALGSSFTTLSLIGNFTSDGLSVPEDSSVKTPTKTLRNIANDSTMLEKTDK